MKYTYSKIINSDKLYLEIKNVLALNLNGVDGHIETKGEQLDIYTNTELNPTQKATLDTIVNAHTTDFPEMDFKPELFLTRFAEEFTSLERLELSRSAPSFTIELMYHNFAEITQIRDYLLQTEEITETQADLINSLFAEQNINLDDYVVTGGTGV